MCDSVTGLCAVNLVGTGKTVQNVTVEIPSSVLVTQDVLIMTVRIFVHVKKGYFRTTSGECEGHNLDAVLITQLCVRHSVLSKIRF